MKRQRLNNKEKTTKMLLCVCSHVTVQCNPALVGKLCMFLGGSPTSLPPSSPTGET